MRLPWNGQQQQHDNTNSGSKEMDWKRSSDPYSGFDSQYGQGQKEQASRRSRRRTRSGFLKRRVASTSTSPSLDIYSVVATIESNAISVPLTLKHNIKDEIVEEEALIDSGAGGIFIDQNYVNKLQLDTKLLDTPVKARNVDGTINKTGTIKSYVNLSFTIGDRKCQNRFYFTGLGKQKIILGFTWLQENNPEINWKTGTIKW